MDLSESVLLSRDECHILRTIIQKAQGVNWPIAWTAEPVKAVIEKIIPTVELFTQGEK